MGSGFGKGDTAGSIWARGRRLCRVGEEEGKRKGSIVWYAGVGDGVDTYTHIAPYMSIS